MSVRCIQKIVTANVAVVLVNVAVVAVAFNLISCGCFSSAERHGNVCAFQTKLL